MAERHSNHSESRPGHLPVLLEPTLELLAVRAGGTYVDGTFGGGGHTRAILERSAPDGRILALDADPAAVARGGLLRNEFGERLTVQQSNFSRLGDVARAEGYAPVDGVLLDLGLSSFQLDDRERGFSLHSDARLDMRLDPGAESPNAWEIVNQWSEEAIADVIFRYGEEHRSRRIARAIVSRRAEAPIESNAQLAGIVERALGGRRGARIHPATKTFQGIRIAVNRELESLEMALVQANEILRIGGRFAVISFHSLEDRIVKQYFQQESRDCICPPEVPVCQCDHRASLRVITRRPVTPDESELTANPRSRSAKLRVAERIT